jgi:hypothetical protein
MLFDSIRLKYLIIFFIKKSRLHSFILFHPSYAAESARGGFNKLYDALSVV